MSLSPQQHDRLDYEEAVKAVANTHNLLIISGVPAGTLLAAEGACLSVVFGNIIKEHPEAGRQWLDNWLASVKRMALLGS